jgi:hypothetical protein
MEKRLSTAAARAQQNRPFSLVWPSISSATLRAAVSALQDWQ